VDKQDNLLLVQLHSAGIEETWKKL